MLLGLETLLKEIIKISLQHIFTHTHTKLTSEVYFYIVWVKGKRKYGPNSPVSVI
jgi:hypothetical protein